jgi:hypothetical protein
MCARTIYVLSFVFPSSASSSFRRLLAREIFVRKFVLFAVATLLYLLLLLEEVE